MKKLYKYIVRSYIGTFLFTFFIAIFILMMQFLWTYLDDLAGKGVEMSVMGKMLFYTSITFTPMALPLAILLSSLMCFGNLGEFYELVAMKASGISTWKVMRPLLYFSLFMCAVAFVFSNDVLPYATLKSSSLLYDIRKQKMALDIPEGVFYRGIDDYVIKVNHKGLDGNSLYDIMIYDHTDRKGNIKVTTADSGMMAMSLNQKEMVITLYDGTNYTEVIDDEQYKTNKPFERMRFRKQYVTFDLSEFDLTRTDEDRFKNHQNMLNISQLNLALDSLNENYNKSRITYNEGFMRRFSNTNSVDKKLTDNVIGSKKKMTSKEDTLSMLQWPLLLNFNDKERNSIIDMAVSSTKNMKDNVEINIKDFERQQMNIRKHQQVLNKKFALSIACLLFFFIGAPLGAIIRKGGLGLPIVVSVVFFVIYYVTSITAERIALAGDMSMFWGVWLSSWVLFPIGLFLTFKATTDAALLDGESWKKTFNKIFRSNSKNKKS